MKPVRALGVLVAVAAILLLAGPSQAALFIIDNFDTGAQEASQTNIGTSLVSTVSGLLTSDTIGGTRSLQVQVTASDGLDSKLNVLISTGRLSLSNDAGNTGLGTITWDANGAGLGGVDIVPDTNPFFQAWVHDSDLGVIMNIAITDTGNDTATYQASLASGAQFVNKALADFTNAGNVDFNSVDKIVMTLSGPSAQDCSIDLVGITTTPAPEPTTMVLLGIGGVCALGARYRRRSRA